MRAKRSRVPGWLGPGAVGTVSSGGPWAKKNGSVFEKHKEAAMAKAGLRAAVKKDQKHEGKKPGRHPLREGVQWRKQLLLDMRVVTSPGPTSPGGASLLHSGE